MAEIFFPTGCLTTVEHRYNTIKDFLHTHSLVIVEFNKKNGDRRVMECTLDEKLIPITQMPKNKMQGEVLDPPTVDMETISVYCTDVDAWRSFKTNNVICIRSPDPIVEQLEVVAGEGEELMINFSPELLARVNWKPGDNLIWTVNENGQITLKKDTQ